MLSKNVLKDKLQSGFPVIGTWNTLGAPLVTEVFAQAGLDFQIIDLEHGPFMLDKIHRHVSACESVQECTPLVRVPSNEDWMVLQALDQGAYGVVVPQISNKQSAERLISSVKYHPFGKRGFTPFSKAGAFNDNKTTEYVERANKEVLSVVIIESREGLENLDEIVEVSDVDVVYFGAYDLSQALGYPGDVKHHQVVDAIRNGVDLVVRNKKTAGGFVPRRKDDIKWLLDMGMRFITYEVDSSILYTQIKDVTTWFTEESKK
jgi:4-hydroxy-2-oxoheptanedioate aldolase